MRAKHTILARPSELHLAAHFSEESVDSSQIYSYLVLAFLLFASSLAIPKNITCQTFEIKIVYYTACVATADRTILFMKSFLSIRLVLTGRLKQPLNSHKDPLLTLLRYHSKFATYTPPYRYISRHHYKEVLIGSNLYSP